MLEDTNFNLQKMNAKLIFYKAYSYKMKKLHSGKRIRKEIMNQKTIPNNG